MKQIYKKYAMTVGLVWAACFLFFVFAYMLVLGPQYKKKRQVQRQLAEKIQAYESALSAAQQQTRERLGRQIDELKKQLADVVVDFESSPTLTFDIIQMANERQVSSLSIEDKGGHGNSDLPNCECIGETRIDISFTSSFDQFARLLNTLERHRPIVFVDRFSIVRSDQDTNGHQASMNLAVFVRKPQTG